MAFQCFLPVGFLDLTREVIWNKLFIACCQTTGRSCFCCYLLSTHLHVSFVFYHSIMDWTFYGQKLSRNFPSQPLVGMFWSLSQMMVLVNVLHNIQKCHAVHTESILKQRSQTAIYDSDHNILNPKRVERGHFWTSSGRKYPTFLNFKTIFIEVIRKWLKIIRCYMYKNKTTCIVGQMWSIVSTVSKCHCSWMGALV